MNETVLRLQEVGKDYASTVLDGVSLALHRGEVLALTGENGAGKSTLSKIMGGLVRPTRGRLELAGQAYAPGSRREAEQHGVRMVMQELGLVSTLTVAENLALDALPRHRWWRAGWLRRDALHAFAVGQLARIGLQGLDLEAPVSSLGIGQQQMIEIARNLRDNTRVLIFDEPTAMLTPRETDRLFEQIDLLRRQGVAIVYVSHRLEELRRIASTVAVLRDGALVDVRPMADLSEAELVQRMVGREVAEPLDRPARAAGEPVLRVQGLGRGEAVRDVSFELHAGEVLGLAGLVGSGRTELLRLIFGADRADRGRVELLSPGQAQPLCTLPRGWRSPMQAMRAGIGLVTEDRKSQGLLLSQPIRINATLSNVSSVARAGVLRKTFEREQVRGFIDRLRVRCQDGEQAVGTLSGGNQQKVVFARWLHRECRVLLLDEPTRGVDVGARADLYAELERMRQAGLALLVVSSDLRELMGLCDRIGVMRQGALTGLFRRGEWTEQGLLQAAFSDRIAP